MAKQTRKMPSMKKGFEKKSKKKVPRGTFHIQVTLNNTLVTLTTLQGNVILWSTAGTCGFKGARKGTPFAAQSVAEAAARQSIDRGMKQTHVVLNGSGAGRKKALIGLIKAGIGISSIRDVTPLPHNGCRPPKKRRI
uniref:Small ribosomal subunit protein uS11c n=1 Tax=Xylochloris irregularis TaxID=480381 RepID=A0A097KMD6_9CHLO|nr:ribosomal protein S11 [Xylochloris irregularis]AIT94343.1 ribosomal protein S11 [Xylochloris irregularis]